MVVFDGHEYLTDEERRLKEDRERKKYWKKWGPYVSERQWATGKSRSAPLPTAEEAMMSDWVGAVREDYSEDGDAWSRKFCSELQLRFPPLFIASWSHSSALTSLLPRLPPRPRQVPRIPVG